MAEWLYRHWAAAALCMGCFLLLLAPLLAASWSVALVLVYLHSPVYMLHQFEEHHRDRFRLFANQQAGGEVLSPAAVLWINIPGVWGVTLFSLYGARFLGMGLGLIAVYLTLVNGIAHVAVSLKIRRYNPGLWTSLLLFLPVSGYAASVIGAEPGVGRQDHLTGLGVAIAIHAAIIAHALSRARQFRGRPPQTDIPA